MEKIKLKFPWDAHDNTVVKEPGVFYPQPRRRRRKGRRNTRNRITIL